MGDNNKNSMQTLWDSSMLDAGSAAWLESLYENFLRNPNEVDPHWREYFATLPRVNGVAVQEIPHDEIREQFRQLTQRKGGLQAVPSVQAVSVNLDHERKQVRVLQLINAYRFRGHQNANLDPLQRRP
ncbi:MAG TPA: 2-oxoglutarate dehydrogenase E1 component, partial [Gammaproteobacteria bacterium]